jgi:hypothetical protein
VRNLAHIAFAIICFVAPAKSNAQCAGVWLPAESMYFAAPIVALSNGDVVVGGITRSTADGAANAIARYTPATNRWTPLGSGLRSYGTASTVTALAAAPNNDIFAGGSFDLAGGVPAPVLARWSDSSQAWAAIPNQPFRSVRAICVLAGGDLIVSGDVPESSSSAHNELLRLNASTGAWSSLGLPSQGGFVAAMTQAPGGDIVICGQFGAISGVNADRVARWNSATQTWSALGSPPLSAVVSSVIVLANDDVVVAGVPTVPTGGAVIRWSAATHTWAPLGASVLAGNGGILSLALLPGGDIVAGGNFVSLGPVQAQAAARWSVASQSWNAMGVSSAALIRGIAPLPGGDIIITGGIQTVESFHGGRCARWNAGNNTWHDLGPGELSSQSVQTSVNAMALLLNGDVVCGGTFDTAGGSPASRVVRKSFATNQWSPMGTGVNGAVHAAATLSNNDVIVGGAFTAAGSISTPHIARWNSTAWSSLGPGLDGPVAALAVTSTGDVLAGGTFTHAGPAPVANIARWDAAASAWVPLGAGLDSTVSALLALPGGDIVAGGSFTSSGGAPLGRIARWSAGESLWAPMGSGMNDQVLALAMLPSGDVVAGGKFTAAGGAPALRVARWDAATSTWTQLGAGLSADVLSLSPYPDGDLLAGGRFVLSGGTHPTAYVARWHATSNAWYPLGKGPDGPVMSALVHPTGDALIGGLFNILSTYEIDNYYVEPVYNRAWARWTSDGPVWITRQPTGGAAIFNGAIQVRTTLAPGYFDVSYQWYHDGVAVQPGAGGASPGGGVASQTSGFFAFTDANEIVLTITGVQLSDAGEYQLRASGPCGDAQTFAASFIVRCPADFDGNGTLSLLDVFFYLNAWFAGDSRADMNHNGLAVQDIFDFLTHWFAGC